MQFHSFLLSAAMFVAAGFCVKAQAPAFDVLPLPKSVELRQGAFNAAGAPVNCDNTFDNAQTAVVKGFADLLAAATGRECGFRRVSAEGTDAARGFVFLMDSSKGEDAYSIVSTPESVVVKAGTRSGILNAVATLKQMLPVEIYIGSAAANVNLAWVMPCASIDDAPRFAYRGMHLDCSRHFFSVQEVKRYLDIMAVYKLNRFHWHLTDDQGWRVEIKSHPELTQIGAWRDGTVIKKQWGTSDGIRYGGFYTQEQIKDIVAYADSLGITVIPEVDLPGHMLGVLAAHPELGCTGGPYKVWQRWGISDDVLCVGKEETFTLLEEVLSEIAGLFPSEYFHIGGDECPKVRWEQCPCCQKKIQELGLKSDSHGTKEQHLQNYVTARIQAFLATKGKKIIGWDEILEGKLAPGATIMSWRGTKGGIAGANAGFDVIMTPNSYMYFDYYQSKDTEAEPFGIGGYLPVEKVYSCDPTEGLDEKAAKHILGVQANLWTEYIATDPHLEYMLMPRMQALSEVQWCEMPTRDTARLWNSLEKHQFRILDLLGYNYRRR